MISSLKYIKQIAICRRVTLTLCCCLLLVPNLPRVYNLQAGAAEPDLANSRHQYNLIGADGFNQQYQHGASNLIDEQGDSSLVAELLNSFAADPQSSELLLKHQQQNQQQHHHGTPGHYEFEVAPQMEPPSAPRPPFKQANHVCPGSDLFGGFSPKDTLCGDLYQGKVPLNPMGQSVNEQAYPFELIKNKTLQFLAKSLPILKTEYETIPKVARYLPANVLLNPTSHQSTLGHGHFHELNQQVAAAQQRRQQLFNADPSTLYPHFIDAPPFLRRRKRSAPPTLVASGNSISININNNNSNNNSSSSSSGSSMSNKQHQASITVAEMLPNATLVVSSAHSAGRIGGGGGHSPRSGDGTLQRHFYPYAMITKDGFKPIGGVIRATTGDADQSQSRPPALTGSGLAAHDSAASRNNQAQRQRVVIDFNVNEDNDDEGASSSVGAAAADVGPSRLQDNDSGTRRRPPSHAGPPTSPFQAPAANGQVNRISPPQVKHNNGDLAPSESAPQASRVSQRSPSVQQQQQTSTATATTTPTTTTSTTTTTTTSTTKPIAMNRNHASSRVEGHAGVAGQHESNGDNGKTASIVQDSSNQLRARSTASGAHQPGDSYLASAAGNGQSSPAAQSSSAALSALAASSSQRSGTGEATNGRSWPQTVNNVQPKTSTGSKSGGGSAILSQQQQQQQQSQQHMKCANVNGLLLYTVCQAASALIEPADSTPSWLQAAKQIGSLYSAISSADSYSSSSSNNPIWSIWNAFSGSSVDRDGGSSSQSAANDLSTASSSPDLAYKSSNGSRSPLASTGASVASVINLLNPLMSFFAPSLQRTNDAGSVTVADQHTSTSSSPSSSSSSSSTSSKSKADHRNSPQQLQNFSSNLKTISNLLLTGLSLAGLYDWLGASGASSSLFSPTSTTFARRKKPFDASETFVDTPASLAAVAASAKQLAPGAASGQPAAPGKQPPTPCPSVEEYISPTFARNYQGAWKYVVQIPHEGYFTQTIQRSSCMHSKCELTDGVCHEAPRWVSLLVAEIYYPNAIFSSTAAGHGLQQQQQQPQAQQSLINQRIFLAAGSSPQQHQFDSGQNAALLSQLMAASPSNQNNLHHRAPFGQLGGPTLVNNNGPATQQHQHHQAKSLSGVQDPLQMTDSLNTYNHNLNSAFFNAAAELGLDPTNAAQMQQLASAHNYQLIQRNGLVEAAARQSGSGHQPQLEARSGHSSQSQQQQQANNNKTHGLYQQHNRHQQAAVQQQQLAASQAPAQFEQASQQQQQQQLFNNDYIRALALETIRQNPHLSIDELIKSLQLQQARKKRDLSNQIDINQQQQQPTFMRQMAPATSGSQPQQQQVLYNYMTPADNQYQQHLQQRQQQQAQSRTGPMSLESMPSPNDLGGLTSLAAAQQHQQELDLAGLSVASTIISKHSSQQPGGSGSSNNQTRPMVVPQQSPMDGSQQQANNLQPVTMTSNNNSNGTGNNNNTSNNMQSASATEGQVECDGHDKIGCYVVRVYYDWFLVNGSCKCWKTQTTTGQRQQSAPSSATSGSGSFIRRIFTG